MSSYLLNDKNIEIFSTPSYSWTTILKFYFSYEKYHNERRIIFKNINFLLIFNLKKSIAWKKKTFNDIIRNFKNYLKKRYFKAHIFWSKSVF